MYFSKTSSVLVLAFCLLFILGNANPTNASGIDLFLGGRNWGVRIPIGHQNGHCRPGLSFGYDSQYGYGNGYNGGYGYSSPYGYGNGYYGGYGYGDPYGYRNPYRTRNPYGYGNGYYGGYGYGDPYGYRNPYRPRNPYGYGNGYYGGYDNGCYPHHGGWPNWSR